MLWIVGYPHHNLWISSVKRRVYIEIRPQPSGLNSCWCHPSVLLVECFTQLTFAWLGIETILYNSWTDDFIRSSDEVHWSEITSASRNTCRSKVVAVITIRSSVPLRRVEIKTVESPHHRVSSVLVPVSACLFGWLFLLNLSGGFWCLIILKIIWRVSDLFRCCWVFVVWRIQDKKSVIHKVSFIMN